MLPKIELPVYDFTIPSTEKKIKYRPFTVKERKLLLMAIENDKESEVEKEENVIKAIKQIARNCIVSEDFDINDFAAFDLEFFFLALRARSVGEVSQASYICDNVKDGKQCKGVVDVEINLLEDFVPAVDRTKLTIALSTNVGIQMKYPGMETVKFTDGNAVDVALDYIANCIDFIYDGENITYAKDTPREELIDFLEKLTDQQFVKIEEFVDSIPTVKMYKELPCSKCGFVHVIALEGLQSFFE